MRRYQIRASVYRNREGFTISGGGHGIYAAKVFTESRSSAEHIKRRLIAKQDIRVIDFEPQPQPQRTN